MPAGLMYLLVYPFDINQNVGFGSCISSKSDCNNLAGRRVKMALFFRVVTLQALFRGRSKMYSRNQIVNEEKHEKEMGWILTIKDLIEKIFFLVMHWLLLSQPIVYLFLCRIIKQTIVSTIFGNCHWLVGNGWMFWLSKPTSTR